MNIWVMMTPHVSAKEEESIVAVGCEACTTCSFALNCWMLALFVFSIHVYLFYVFVFDLSSGATFIHNRADAKWMCWDAKLAAVFDTSDHKMLRGTLITGFIQSNELITNWDFWTCLHALRTKSPYCESLSAGENCLHKRESKVHKMGLNRGLFCSQFWHLSCGDVQCKAFPLSVLDWD